MHKKRKSRWVRLFIGALGFWLVAQTNPVFCACLQSAETGGVAQDASRSDPSHHARPGGCCDSKAADNSSAPRHGDPDACPLCHVLGACSPVDQEALSAASAGSLKPITVVLSITDSNRTQNLSKARSPGSADAAPFVAPGRPLFIMKSSFLI